MVFLIAIIIFCTAIDVGYGGWISTFSLNAGIMDEEKSTIAPGIFWLSLTMGRILAIFMTIRFESSVLIFFNLIGALSSLTYLLLFNNSVFGVYFGSALFGLFISSLLPLAFTIPAKFGMITTEKITSIFNSCSCFGDMIIPMAIGYAMDFFGNIFLMWVSLLCIGLILLCYIIATRIGNSLV
jgi:hypothetical protein